MNKSFADFTKDESRVNLLCEDPPSYDNVVNLESKFPGVSVSGYEGGVSHRKNESLITLVEDNFEQDLNFDKKNDKYTPYMRNRRHIRKPFIIIFACLLFIVGLLFFTGVYMYRRGTINIEILKHYMKFRESNKNIDDFTLNNVWSKKIPGIFSFGPMRLVDVNNDAILDVIFEYRTSPIREISSKEICTINEKKKIKCCEGIIALNGKNGEILWDHEIFSSVRTLQCSFDFNGDNVVDCIISMDGNTLGLIDGHTGEEIWSFGYKMKDFKSWRLKSSVDNLLLISDTNHDGVVDILKIDQGNVHDPNSKSETTSLTRILLISGINGELLNEERIFNEEDQISNLVPVSLSDSSKGILFSTIQQSNSKTKSTSDRITIKLISLDDFIRGRILNGSKTILKKINDQKSSMDLTTPILADLNQDSWPEIIDCPFSNMCSALDTRNFFNPFWSFSINKTTRNPLYPTLGFYNSDEVPDLFAQFETTSSTNVNSNQVLIIDGKDGSVLKTLNEGYSGMKSNPLIVSMQDFGNDIFLYWSRACQGGNLDQINLNNLEFETDACLKKFNQSSEISLKAVFNERPSGKVLFKSDANKLKVLKGRDASLQEIYPELKEFFEYYHMNHKKPKVLNKNHEVKPNEERSRKVIHSVSSTGSLAPSLSESILDNSVDPSSIDLIFGVNYGESVDLGNFSRGQLDCLKKWIPKGYNIYDMEKLENFFETAIYECLVSPDSSTTQFFQGGTIINRKQFTFDCSSRGKQLCSHPLPFHRQAWPQYMGFDSSSYWRGHT